jgi:hypothetical protein
MGGDAPLQIADRPRADPGTRREFFLGQMRRKTMLLQQDGEGGTSVRIGSHILPPRRGGGRD